MVQYKLQFTLISDASDCSLLINRYKLENRNVTSDDCYHSQPQTLTSDKRVPFHHCIMYCKTENMSFFNVDLT